MVRGSESPRDPEGAAPTGFEEARQRGLGPRAALAKMEPAPKRTAPAPQGGCPEEEGGRAGREARARRRVRKRRKPACYRKLIRAAGHRPVSITARRRLMSQRPSRFTTSSS